MSKPYDAIVVGSGLGGLTTASFLAREGMKVLVLEQHSQIGGYAHSFKRRGFTFESGIHSVPMGERGLILHLLRLLGVESMIEAIPQDSMFKFIMPGFSYTVPARREDFVDKLKHDFPDESDAIDRLLVAMAGICEAMIGRVYTMERTFVEEDREFASRFLNVSYAQFVGNYITDERLRSIFFAQWPYGGTAPSTAPAIFYTVMFFVHYLEGSHYCKGGFQSLVAALAHAITSSDGTIVTRKRVVRLACSGNTVQAVHCDDGDVFEAPIVVSNVSPYQLHGTLIDESARNKIWQRRLSNLRPSLSGVAVYCGLDRPVSYFVDEPVLLWFKNDFETIYANIRDGNLDSRDHLAILSSPEEECRTLQLIYFADGKSPRNWKEKKNETAAWMLAKANELLPGLRDAVVLTETGSPSTFERYTANTHGAFYGFENAKDIYSEAKLPINTYLRNLYQVGHWGKPGGGVWNVMMNGYVGAKTILRGERDVEVET